MKFFLGVLLGLIIVAVAGCEWMIKPDPKNADAIATYNNQVFQIWTQVISIFVIIATAVGLAIRMAVESRNANERRERDKKELAEFTRMAAETLKQDAQRRTDKVLTEVQEVKSEVKEAKAVNATALEAANNYNAKLLAVQQLATAQPPRAPSRATDKTDFVQKVEIAGQTAPVLVTETKPKGEGK